MVVDHGVDIGISLGSRLVVLVVPMLLALREPLVEESLRVLGPADPASFLLSPNLRRYAGLWTHPENLTKRITS